MVEEEEVVEEEPPAKREIVVRNVKQFGFVSFRGNRLSLQFAVPSPDRPCCSAVSFLLSADRYRAPGPSVSHHQPGAPLLCEVQ